MLEIIGSKNCSKCNTVKKDLDSKNIEYEYKILEELQQHDKEKYIQMAKAVNQYYLPLIIRDNTLISLQEV
jgi:glutaredoxin